MLAAVPPSRTIPWTREVGRQLLPPEPDGGEQQDQRIERVLAAPRIGRGVGLEAVEHDIYVLGRERVALDVVAVARVVEQGGVETLQQPVLDHDRLAAPPFLRRRAEEHDLAGKLVGDRRQGDGRADPRCGHRVVAAAMAQTGKRVVLGEDPDPRPVAAAPAAQRGADGRLETPGRSRDLVAVGSQPLGDPARGLALLERRLGVRVDPMGQVEDLVTRGLDGGGQPGFGVSMGFGRADGRQDGHGTSDPGRDQPGVAARTRWADAGYRVKDARSGGCVAVVSARPRGSPRPRPPAPR